MSHVFLLTLHSLVKTMTTYSLLTGLLLELFRWLQPCVQSSLETLGKLLFLLARSTEINFGSQWCFLWESIFQWRHRNRGLQWHTCLDDTNHLQFWFQLWGLQGWEDVVCLWQLKCRKVHLVALWTTRMIFSSSMKNWSLRRQHQSQSVH